MKSIFKRVLVGVLVALILSFIRGNLFIGVSAKALYSHWTGSAQYWTTAPGSAPYVSGIYVPINGAPFKNSGYGYINFSFSVSSSIASYSTATPFEVLSDYQIQTACNISSSSQNGSVNFQTPYNNFGVATYTAVCPVYITDNNYLKGFNIRFLWPSGSGEAVVRTSNIVTFYRFDDNVENALNNQTNNIINNQNQNSQNIVNSQKEIKDTLNNDDTSSAQSNGNSFFSNFQSDSHGLSGIITAPLRLLNSFTTASCQPLNFQLPILHNDVSLPCMKGIYEDKFGVFFSLWQLITTGLISYNVCINLYSKVRNLQNPRNDRIEVLNL